MAKHHDKKPQVQGAGIELTGIPGELITALISNRDDSDWAISEVIREEKEIELTQKEFLLLEYLARHANQVVSKNQLLENAWGLHFDPKSNIVEVYMY